MDKLAVCGEFIFLISNYEKCRFKTFLTKKHRNSIYDSLKLMKSISYRMENSSISTDDIECLNKCLHHPYIKEILIANSISFSFDTSMFCYSNSSGNTIINRAMSRLLDEMMFILKSESKHYKEKLRRMLRALHNLPKVYLNPCYKTLFGMVDGLDFNTAIKYSMEWLSDQEKKQIFNF